MGRTIDKGAYILGNGNDAKEIYQAVLYEIRNELPNIMIQYRESILQDEKQQVEKIVSRVAELERKNEQLEGKIAILNQRVSKLEREGVGCSPVGTSANSEKSLSKAADKVDMSRYDILLGYKSKGWVYYENVEMGGLLYKVRADGTGNQQLTDYPVYLDGCKAQNHKLYFDDCYYIKHSIDI